MKLKFIISGILIVVIGLVLSHTYRPYVYEYIFRSIPVHFPAAY